MAAGSIVFAHYLAHDKVLQPVGMRREKGIRPASIKGLPSHITYYICHAVAPLGRKHSIGRHNGKQLVQEELKEHLVPRIRASVGWHSTWCT